MDSYNEEDILAHQFPDNVSLSDICDCGRHIRPKKGDPKLLKSCQRSTVFPESNYKQNYRGIFDPRPRSSKRPPPSARDLNPPPMALLSQQRADFKPLGAVPKTKPIIMEQKYEPPKERLDGLTNYTKDYPQKALLPGLVKVTAPTEQYRKSSAKFESRTTAREHFKPWVPERSLAFEELPSFADSILFPEKKPLPQSVTRESYPAKYAPRVELHKMAEGTLKMEGDATHVTTHRDTFKSFDGDHRALKVIQKPDTIHQSKAKFSTITQSQRDFPGFRGRQPAPPLAAEPAQPTIDLRFDNIRNFATEQRSFFKGHDTREFPVQKSSKKDDGEYHPPTVKFETSTSQKRDFQPIDMQAAYQPRVAMPEAVMHTTDAPFDDRTMSKQFFKSWKMEPRIRYGDFHENHTYIPPRDKFNAQTTTASVYKRPNAGTPPINYKPVPTEISREGKHDFSTVYQSTYKGQKIKMCPAQVYLIQQEIKKKNPAAKTRNNVNSRRPSRRQSKEKHVIAVK